MTPTVVSVFENTLRFKNRLIGVGWHRDPFRHFGPGGIDEAERLCEEANRDLLAFVRPPADARADNVIVAASRSVFPRPAGAAISFDSPFPSRRGPNDRVVARLFPARRPRADGRALVVHHPLLQRTWALWAWFLAPITERVPVVMMAAPYHFERRPEGEYPGEGMVNPNPYRVFECFRQWAWDQQALTNALPSALGLTPAAVIGFSLGAFQSLLVASAGGLDRMPIVSIAATNRYAYGLHEGVLGKGTVEGLRRAGIGRERLERMVESIQLERHVPRLTGRSVLYIAGRYDAVDPHPSGVRLEAALNPTRSVWLDVGHATLALERDRIARETFRFLEECGVL